MEWTRVAEIVPARHTALCRKLRMCPIGGVDDVKPVSFLRAYFARVDDPYAGGDLGNAQRIGTVIWGLLVALAVLLVPLNPPTNVVGSVGWAVAALLLCAGIGAAYAMRRERLGSWGALLLLSYGTVVA